MDVGSFILSSRTFLCRPGNLPLPFPRQSRHFFPKLLTSNALPRLFTGSSASRFPNLYPLFTSPINIRRFVFPSKASHTSWRSSIAIYRTHLKRKYWAVKNLNYRPLVRHKSGSRTVTSMAEGNVLLHVRRWMALEGYRSLRKLTPTAREGPIGTQSSHSRNALRQVFPVQRHYNLQSQ